MYCANNYEEFRPKEFPVDLWDYVFDVEKEKIIKRFEDLRSQIAYDTEAMIENQTEGEPLDRDKLPKNRLEEILEKLLVIDISTETPSRALEKPFFLAQCLANIDRFGHPNPTDPAKAKGSVFKNELEDDRLPPCSRKGKKLATATYWSLRRRIEHMLSRGEIVPSKSNWNSPPMMVAQPDKIQKFMSKHGDKALQLTDGGSSICR